jgi:hypothetical protein
MYESSQSIGTKRETLAALLKSISNRWLVAAMMERDCSKLDKLQLGLKTQPDNGDDLCEVGAPSASDPDEDGVL